MGKKAFAIVIALVATQLLSGCYILRELNWSKDLVPKGEEHQGDHRASAVRR